jgi:hypothetical protein
VGLSGLVPLTEEKRPKDVRERKACTVEPEAQELPPDTNAAAMFGDSIRTLETYLEHVISLKERLQGPYFIDEGETEEDNVREARGGQRHPHPYLVALIGAYVLEHPGRH